MSRIPHTAREHLRRQAPAGDHPDANLLSAFAEGALSAAERGSVMQHVASCAGCRESLALAQPEPAEVLPAGREFGAWWLRWPTLRWAGLTVSAVVITAALVFQLSQPAAEYRGAGAVTEQSAARVASAPSQAKAEAGSPASAAASADAAPAKDVAADTKADVAPPRAKRQEPAREMAATAGVTDELRIAVKPAPAERKAPATLSAQTKSDQPFMRDPIVPPPVERDDIRPATTQPAGGYAMTTPEAWKKTGGVIYESESKLEKAEVAKEGKAEPPAADAAAQPSAASEMARMNEGQKVEVARSRFASSAGAPPPAAGLMAVGEARWRLVDGELQRSFDDGRNWEDVAIAAEVTPRAVGARAPAVWVAGDQRELYRSSDNGLRWERVRLPDALTGEVRDIKAGDRLRVDITTSTGERWTTEDGGKTWTKK
jgi:hypothetical protein